MVTVTTSSLVHLTDRLDSVEAEVRDLDKLLVSVQERGARLPGSDQIELVKKRLERSMGQRLDPLQHRLQLLKASTSPPADQWKELDSIAQRLDGLSDELLPVAHGALARAAGLDDGVCALAEEVVAELAPLTAGGERVVVPAARDHTSSGMWVIRLAVRHDGVWSLPIVAHEFGHVVAADLKDEYEQPLGYKLLEGSWRKNALLPPEAVALPGFLPYSRAVELFADIFAAYCMGPAYAAALMARSVPVGAWKVRYDHPPFAARLRAVFRVLDGIGASWVRDMVQADWEKSLAAVGEHDDPPVSLAAQVDIFTEAGLEVMELTASRARFDGSDILSVGRLLREAQSPASDMGLRTVINAAWAERVRERSAMGKIERGLRNWLARRPPVLVGLP